MEQEVRAIFYREHLENIKNYSAFFAVPDYYAMEGRLKSPTFKPSVHFLFNHSPHRTR